MSDGGPSPKRWVGRTHPQARAIRTADHKVGDGGAHRSVGTAPSTRLKSLESADLVVEDNAIESCGGPAATTVRLVDNSGVVAAADLSRSSASLGVTDLHGDVLAVTIDNQSMSIRPDLYLQWLTERLGVMVARAGRDIRELRGVGIGLPGPVRPTTGSPYGHPSMPGWSDFPVAHFLRDRLGVPAVVNNDVNLVAWGEFISGWNAEASNLLFVNVTDAGVGCGIISDGRIYRGVGGSAGAIGHIAVDGYEDSSCGCGKGGCLDAVVGGDSVVTRMREAGFGVNRGSDVADLALSGNITAVHEIRNCGRALGEVTADLVNFFNPDVIVIGGVFTKAHILFIGGLREVLYRECTHLGLRDLRLAPANSDISSAVLGAAALTIEELMSPGAEGELVGDTRSWG